MPEDRDIIENVRLAREAAYLDGEDEDDEDDPRDDPDYSRAEVEYEAWLDAGY